VQPAPCRPWPAAAKQPDRRVAALLCALVVTACGSSGGQPSARVDDLDELVAKLRAAGLPCDDFTENPGTTESRSGSCNNTAVREPCPANTDQVQEPLPGGRRLPSCPQQVPSVDLQLVVFADDDTSGAFSSVSSLGQEPPALVSGANFTVVGPASLAERIAEATGGRVVMPR